MGPQPWAFFLCFLQLQAERPQDFRQRLQPSSYEPGPGADGQDSKEGAFNYSDLNSQISRLKKEASEYEDQVKGPVVDHADMWLQQKSRYQEFVKELNHGMNVQKQLVHKLRTEERKRALGKMKEAKKETNSTNSTEGKANQSQAEPSPK
ncbi:CanA1 [Symbiodinium pilosum]|uniref:CanA1 protein n=1 Tax=Symbiodinium pilosum TaxID=2952 RepID=A0A812SKT5_SYMPI|nr:CanA1 [Symbiodinium pilosum]